MDYHKRLCKELNAAEQGQLKSLFYNAALARDQVTYDVNEGVIVNIDGLNRDTDGSFSMTPDAPTPTDLQSIKKFKPVSIEQLSAASMGIKIKPNVVKKAF